MSHVPFLRVYVGVCVGVRCVCMGVCGVLEGGMVVWWVCVCMGEREGDQPYADKCLGLEDHWPLSLPPCVCDVLVGVCNRLVYFVK